MVSFPFLLFHYEPVQTMVSNLREPDGSQQLATGEETVCCLLTFPLEMVQMLLTKLEIDLASLLAGGMFAPAECIGDLGWWDRFIQLPTTCVQLIP